MAPTILVEHLSKTYEVHRKLPGIVGSLRGLIHRQYDHVEAVNDISFLIEPGELVGFIGPNGAGKTTTLKMLAGLLYPSRGQVRVLGYDPWQRDYAFLTQISLVMGQKNQLWWDLPASESFALAKDIYGLEDSVYQDTLRELVTMLDLQDVLNIQVRKLSLGQRMKAELVAALIHRPQVLFLDEPTIGLDVVMQQAMRNFIRDYNRTFGGSIILTSHYMEDVKELCQRVIIIDKGKLLYDGLLADVITKFSKHKIIEVILAKPVPAAELQKIKGFQDLSGNIAHYRILRNQIAGLAGEILKKLPVADLNITEVAIEDVIRRVFTKT